MGRMTSIYEMESKIHVPNHQPAISLLYPYLLAIGPLVQRKAYEVVFFVIHPYSYIPIS